MQTAQAKYKRSGRSTANRASGPALLRGRFGVVYLGLLLALFGLLWRAVHLTVVDRSFLQQQNQARVMRTVVVPAQRGMITDRHGAPLAVSVPVYSIWVNPQQAVHWSVAQFTQLAKVLHKPSARLQARVLRAADQHKVFLYLQRNQAPQSWAAVQRLQLPGVHSERSMHRYYPLGAVTAHVLGRTDIDDRGQEGIELAYQAWLSGQPGAQRVIKDRRGHVVSELGIIRPPKRGQALPLSLDRQLQYVAYRELQRGLQTSGAKSGSVVVLSVSTGEVLAMVNQPSFNPNQHGRARPGHARNRAVTDVFEPGSLMKTIALARVLQADGKTPQSVVNTHPGLLVVEGKRIMDEHLDYGKITVTQVLQKSSNIGMAKLALDLPPTALWTFYRRMGFGVIPSLAFPGAVAGSLVVPKRPRRFARAVLSFGYGVTASALQMASAYAVIANDGVRLPLTLLKRTQPVVGERVLSTQIAQQVRRMLATVVQPGGTGTRAQVPGEQVAGKTGTAYIAGPHGYDNHRVIASFIGMAPVLQPRYVCAVVLNEPQVKHHFGGLLAAPIFSKVMGAALRLNPDNA